MKKILFIAFASFGLLFSCDRIDNPYIPIANVDLDTNYYDGNWSEYVANEWPTFVDNPNTDRNVLLEDYTGHKCPNCPSATLIAEQIHDAHPTRVFVAAIHGGPNPTTGVTAFQTTDATYTRDFTTPETKAYGMEFTNNGFFANPQGTINRFPYGTNNDGSEMFRFSGTWTTEVNDMLNANDLKADIQASSNFYDAAGGGYIHTEIEFKEAMTGTYKIVSYVIQDLIVDKQNDGGATIPDYEHKDVLIGTIDGQAWGQDLITGAVTSGQKVTKDYSYEIPAGLTKDDIHFLIYVYDTSTMEILQVIKHKF